MQFLEFAFLSSAIRGVGVAITVACALSGPAAAAESGDAKRGFEVFKACMGCHKVGEGAVHSVGPHLNGVYGRKAAGLTSYKKYSKAMRRAGADGLVWDLKNLDLYIENPKNLISKSRMNFRGLNDPRARADLLAYLRLFSDNPRDIPEAAPTAATRDPEVDPAVLTIVGDPEYGEYLSGECITCHQASGSDEGIPSITGWPVVDFVTAMQAYKIEARPHPVMRMIAGRLSDEEIAGLAAYFNALE